MILILIALVIIAAILFAVYIKEQPDETGCPEYDIIIDINNNSNNFIESSKSLYDDYCTKLNEIEPLIIGNILPQEQKTKLHQLIFNYSNLLCTKITVMIEFITNNKEKNPFSTVKDVKIKSYRNIISHMMDKLEYKYKNIDYGIDEIKVGNKKIDDINDVIMHMEIMDIINMSIENAYKQLEQCYDDSLVIMMKEQEKVKAILGNYSFSENRDDYIIKNDHYKRNNSGDYGDREFYKKHKGHLFELYENRCPGCNKLGSLEIDHFVFAKSYGGTFIMEHKDGHLISNAIPLCRSCNASKSDIPHDKFFSSEQIKRIMKINQVMTDRINEILISDDEFMYEAMIAKEDES